MGSGGPTIKGGSGERQQRLRYGNLPRPGSSETRYAESRDELKNISFAERTRIFMGSAAFHAVVAPELERMEAEAPGNGRPRWWSAQDLETVFVYSRIAKKRSIKEGLQALAGDARGRLAFGFTRRRGARRTGHRTIHACLPSETTMSRFLQQRWNEERHMELYRDLDRRLFEEMLQIDDFAEEMRVLDVDGTCVEIHHKADVWSRPDSKGRRKLIRSGTVADAGYVPGDGPKSGHGYHLTLLSTHRGTIVDWVVEPRQESELGMASKLVDRYATDVAPLIDDRGPATLSGDGLFSSNDFRGQCHRANLLTNIHEVSHAERRSSRRRAAEFSKRRIPIDDRGNNPNYANWFANGHHELVCRCGNGRTEKDVATRNGRLAVSTRGRCKTCGDVRITAGRWRLVRNWGRPGRSAFVPCERDDEPTWSFGNPLTFNDDLSRKYGRARFGHQEGLNGALVNGYGLIKGRRWFRRQTQAELDCALVFSIMKTLALEQHHRSKAQRRSVTGLADRTGPAPPAALAA